MENCSSNEVVSVNFNQDSTSVAVSTKSFYRLYSLGPDYRVETIHESLSNEAFIIERLFLSSLIAVVTFSSPRRLQVCHFKKGTEICNFSYGSNIVAVKLNRARLVVVLQEALHIHNIRDMKVLHSVKDTPANYSGICALSPDNDNCLLAYPGSANTGEVQVFDAFNLVAKLTIPAHNSPLAALAFNSSGTKLATASGKGTVIRVFNVADGSRLFELRRGVKRFATIYSLAFSSDSRFLAASSNTETVHVFRMDDTKESEKENSDAGSTGWMGYLSKAVSVSASYLPYPVTEVLNQGRSFATAHLPFQGIRNVCALHTARQQLRLLVASFDGNLYVYAVNPNAGGECNLIVQHRLNETAEGTNGPLESSETVANRPKNSTNESYAGKLKGRPLSSQMTDSEKYREMLAATETPPKTALKLDDEQEFPPMTHQIN